MQKKKNGFTMVELLTTIVILGVLTLIAVPAIGGIINKVRNQYYYTIEGNVEIAGRDYFSQNRGERPKVEEYTSKVELASLMDLKFIEEVVTSKGGERCNGYVLAIKKPKNKMEYHSCITCGTEYKTNNKYCEADYDPGNNDKVYTVKAPAPFKSYLGETLKQKYGQVFQRGILINDKLLPKDTSTVKTKQEGTYPLEYSYENAKDTTEVTIYELKPPTITLYEVNDNNVNLSNYYGAWTKENVRQYFSSANANGYQYSLSSGSTGWTTISNNSILKTDMNQTRYVRARDSEGHVSKPSSYTVKIDKKAPGVTYTPGTRYDNQDLDVKINITDTGSGPKEFKYCTTTSTTCTPTKLVSSPSSTVKLTTHSSTNKICVKGYDNVGNESSTFCSDNYKIDKAPNCPVFTANIDAKTWTNEQLKLTVTPNSNTYNYDYYVWEPSLDNYQRYYSNKTGVFTDTVGGEGMRQAKVVVRNQAGNERTCYSEEYYIDKTAPSCPTITADKDEKKWTNQNVNLTIAPTSDTASWEWATNTDGGEYTTWGTPSGSAKTSVDFSGAGKRQGRVIVKDKVGNSRTCYTKEYYIDKTSPTCTTTGGNDKVYAMKREVTINCSDTGGSGCTVDKRNKTYDEDQALIYTYYVYDNAGNKGECKATVLISTKKPEVTLEFERDWTPARKCCLFPISRGINSLLPLTSVEWSGTGLYQCNCTNSFNCISDCIVKANVNSGSFYITLTATNEAGTTAVTRWYNLLPNTSCPAGTENACP